MKGNTMSEIDQLVRNLANAREAEHQAQLGLDGIQKAIEEKNQRK